MKRALHGTPLQRVRLFPQHNIGFLDELVNIGVCTWQDYLKFHYIKL